jgi:hypothetical protein
MVHAMPLVYLPKKCSNSHNLGKEKAAQKVKKKKAAALQSKLLIRIGHRLIISDKAFFP